MIFYDVVHSIATINWMCWGLVGILWRVNRESDMQKINDGGPAFPISPKIGMEVGFDGMSLRDYFAAKAMQGFMASNCKDSCYEFAKHSYAMADAMLAAREWE